MATSYKLFTFEDDGIIPNNPNLPGIFYPGAFKDYPHEIESTFNLNNWKNSWVDSVFDYHHYHSDAHEVLGVLAGSATLILGGPKGELINFATGDVVVLPAGTGHKRVSSSSDFQIVGAYPKGQEFNVRIGNPEERPQALKEIQEVKAPATDPVFGNEGQVLNQWN